MARSDGTVYIDTRIDTSGFDSGTKDMEKSMDSSAVKINKILADTERSAKSKAASIAAIYRKQGLTQQEAFKKAWEQIERDSKNGSKYVKKQIKGIGEQSKMSGEEMESSFTNAFLKLGKVLASVFAISKIVQFGKKAIELGSDLQEVQNVVDVTFTTMSDKVNEFAKSAIESAGLSETMAKKYVGTFGAMAKSFGFAESEAFNMSTALTQLSGDVASFYNITQDEAYTKLKSVFTGETESLKDLGVVMTQTALDSFAMAEGLGKTTKQMTEQEKVALRYRFVLNQLSGAQGDFARNSDSWANQVKMLKLNIESIMASVGQALINFFTPIIKLINVLLSKIAVLANSFKAFSEMIMGKKSSSGGGGIGQTASDLADLESGYGGAADKAEDLASATKKADKANQKYLSGLDEIRTFTSKDEGGGGIGDISAIAGGFGGVDFGTIEKGNTALEDTNKIIDNLLKRMKELAGLFKKGFADGLGDVSGRLNTIKKAAASIKKSLSDIFDKETMGAFDNMLDTFAYSLGQITGSIASVGLSIGANLMGGISKYLESDKGRIKQYLIDMMDISSDIMAQAGNYASALAYIFEVIASDSGQQITADIIGIFSEAFLGVHRLASTIMRDVFKAITQPIIDTKETIKNSLQDLLNGLSEVTSAIKQIFVDLIDFVMSLYNGTIAPIFQHLQERLTELLESHLSPFFSQLGELLGVWGEYIKLLWNTILKPLIQWIIQNIAPVIVPIVNSIVTVVGNAIGGIMDKITFLLQGVTGLINFIVGTFTGDWTRAWNGIRDIFSGIINSISSMIETFVNGASSLINGLIGSFNKITSIVGIPSIPEIPKLNIPKLATGAVIPPNAPFMAMLGDQKHGTNIEAPLDTIKQAVREVIGGATGNAPIHAHLYLDGKEVFESIIEQGRMQQASTGRNAFATL